MHSKNQNSVPTEINMQQALFSIMSMVFGVFMMMLLFVALFSGFAF